MSVSLHNFIIHCGGGERGTQDPLRLQPLRSVCAGRIGTRAAIQARQGSTASQVMVAERRACTGARSTSPTPTTSLHTTQTSTINPGSLEDGGWNQYLMILVNRVLAGSSPRHGASRSLARVRSSSTQRCEGCADVQLMSQQKCEKK